LRDQRMRGRRDVVLERNRFTAIGDPAAHSSVAPSPRARDPLRLKRVNIAALDGSKKQKTQSILGRRGVLRPGKAADMCSLNVQIDYISISHIDIVAIKLHI
jgi:hypothetical protein